MHLSSLHQNSLTTGLAMPLTYSKHGYGLWLLEPFSFINLK
jgi:hypothetical protein